jgi:glycosyltransferase involved in cell wall biosynthesis
MKDIYLSIIIPCYNESENIKRGVLNQVGKFMESKDFGWEVIISDDGSSDSSVDLVKKQIKELEEFRLLENTHGGKPSALWYGIKAAKGKYVLFSDMDQSTPIVELDKLLPYLKNEYKAVIGSRGYARKSFPFYRRLGSFVFTALRKTIILPEINDTQCGFKVFDRFIALKYFPEMEFFKNKKTIKGWKVTSWDVEYLYILKKKGIKIKEVLVDWRDVDVSKSKGGGLGRYIRESKEMFMQIIRVKFNDTKGLYKL